MRKSRSSRTITASTKRNWTSKIAAFARAPGNGRIRRKSRKFCGAAGKKWRRCGRSLPRKSSCWSGTVITLLADANIQGQMTLLAAYLQAEPWNEFWEYLHLRCLTFADVGLDPADTDATVWQRCQELGILLVTDNRNEDGPDSLETTIRTRNTPEKLPVFTIGNAQSVKSSRAY